MNRTEHLLTIVAEECAEVAQRAAKAARFGLAQVQRDANDRPEDNPELLDNRERIIREYYDLRAVLGMLGIDAWANTDESRRLEAQKVEKVERYFQRSMRCGTLDV